MRIQVKVRESEIEIPNWGYNLSLKELAEFKRAFEIVATLVGYGAEPSEIADEVGDFDHAATYARELVDAALLYKLAVQVEALGVADLGDRTVATVVVLGAGAVSDIEISFSLAREKENT